MTIIYTHEFYVCVFNLETKEMICILTCTRFYTVVGKTINVFYFVSFENKTAVICLFNKVIMVGFLVIGNELDRLLSHSISSCICGRHYT